MNLPLGRMLEQGLELKEKAVLLRIQAMMEQEFTGYLCLTIEGPTGFEEATFLFRKGLLIGMVYNFASLNKEFVGEKALKLALNSIKADKGILDISALTAQQIDLILAFNEEIKIGKNYNFKEVRKMIPPKFETEHSSDLVKAKKEETRADIFKELGIAGLE